MLHKPSFVLLFFYPLLRIQIDLFNKILQPPFKESDLNCQQYNFFHNLHDVSKGKRLLRLHISLKYNFILTTLIFNIDCSLHTTLIVYILLSIVQSNVQSIVMCENHMHYLRDKFFTFFFVKSNNIPVVELPRG